MGRSARGRILNPQTRSEIQMGTNNLRLNRFTSIVFSTLACLLLAPASVSAADKKSGEKTAPAAPKPAVYKVDTSRKDSVDDFNAFLRRCSLEERACLMQSLMGLDDFKLAKHHFGKLKNVKDWDAYADKEKKATKEKPIRPKTFNDVPPATVVDAIDRGILPESCVSPSAIRKELLWNCCNKLRYHGLNDKKVDYHKEAIQWVCGKHDLPKVQIDTLSTFDLEKKFIEKYFEEIWDKLTPKQRTDLLGAIEGSSKSTIANKAGIAAMSGGAAIAALGTTVAFTGFAFYTTMSTVMATVAGWVGATLPFAAYTGASTTVAIFAGPVGWGIAGCSLLGGAIAAGWPDSQKTANFVITVHLIKSRWAENDGQSVSAAGNRSGK